MAMINLTKLLSDNGFNCYHDPKYSSYIVENLMILKFEPTLKYISIPQWHNSPFYIFINFKCYNMMDKPNYGLNIDVSKYCVITGENCIVKRVSNENEIIEELQRLNNFGINIKG